MHEYMHLMECTLTENYTCMQVGLLFFSSFFSSFFTSFTFFSSFFSSFFFSSFSGSFLELAFLDLHRQGQGHIIYACIYYIYNHGYICCVSRARATHLKRRAGEGDCMHGEHADMASQPNYRIQTINYPIGAFQLT